MNDKLDEMGEWVVAYKSPIVDRTGSEKFRCRRLHNL